jgi:hypothetical protein
VRALDIRTPASAVHGRRTDVLFEKRAQRGGGWYARRSPEAMLTQLAAGAGAFSVDDVKTEQSCTG